MHVLHFPQVILHDCAIDAHPYQLLKILQIKEELLSLQPKHIKLIVIYTLYAIYYSFYKAAVKAFYYKAIF